MGIQENNLNIFLWYLYDQSFFIQTNQELGAHKKMTLRSQAKTKSPFPENPFFYNVLTLKEYYGNRYIGEL